MISFMRIFLRAKKTRQILINNYSKLLCSNFNPYLCADGQQSFAVVKEEDQAPNLKAINDSKPKLVFKDYITTAKAAARRSFVIQDLSTNSFVWHQVDDDIKNNLFSDIPKENVRIMRWRINKKKKAFFLLFEVDFYVQSILNLQTNFNMHFLEKVGFIQNVNIEKWRKELDLSCMSYSIERSPNYCYEDNMFEMVIDAPSSPTQRFEFLEITDESVIDPHEQIIDKRQEIQNILENINKALKNRELMPDIQTKLRFFLLVQTEDIIMSALLSQKRNTIIFKNSKNGSDSLSFNNFELIPFGSDVSGLATRTSDVDFVFAHPNSYRLTNTSRISSRDSRAILHIFAKTLGRRVEFNKKETDNETVLFEFSHFYQIEKIMFAFVPIIKCRSRLMPNVNIDISVNSDGSAGIPTAQYLYHCNYNCDSSVRPFLILLKLWARRHGIIGRSKFSTFQITSLGIAFLQTKKLIPSVAEWTQSEIGVNVIDRVYNSNTSFSIVLDLFKEFCQFLLAYDFGNNAMNIETGDMYINKPTTALTGYRPIYITNPFCNGLNICQTVHEKELEELLRQCKLTSAVMDKRYRVEEIFRIEDRSLQQTTDTMLESNISF